MIWIIGEYSDRIENANVLLESFLENFSGKKMLIYFVYFILFYLFIYLFIYYLLI
jgi:hypothetical protein